MSDKKICGRRTKRCRKCGYKYAKADYELWECPQCGEDRKCRLPPLPPSDACKLHGGASPKGPASPAWRTGRHSKYLPQGLAEAYQESLADPYLIHLQDEIALCDTMIGFLLQTLERPGGIADWQAAHVALERLNLAIDRAEPLALNEARQALRSAIDGGTGERATRDEISGWINRRRQLAATQQKYLVDIGEYITRAKALTLFGRFIEIVKENVDDRRSVAAIAAAIGTMVAPVRQR